MTYRTSLLLRMMMMMMSVEQSVDYLAGESELSENSCPSAAFSITNPT
jgi:hypothetical protein